MLKANELRVGNWISWKGRPQQVITIEIRQFSKELSIKAGRETYYHIFSSPHLETTENHYEPIPLTPEILEAAGFEHEKGVMSHPVRSMFITTDNVFYLGEVLMVDMQFKVIKIEHVHQLQNLYFALTGNELEINL